MYLPLETFDFPPEQSRCRSSYHVIELGTPYALLRDVLRRIEDTVGTLRQGFGDLLVDEIMAPTRLSREDALRARFQEFDEPCLVNGPPMLIAKICRQIVERGLNWTRGVGFFHLMGNNDKGELRKFFSGVKHRRNANGQGTPRANDSYAKAVEAGALCVDQLWGHPRNVARIRSLRP